MGISYFHISVKDTLTSKAQLVMHDFMDKALLIKKLKDRMLGCRKLISKWIYKFEEKTDIYRQRVAWMHKRWKNEVTTMIGKIIENKDSSKKLRLIWKKLTIVPDDVQSRIIELYLEMWYEQGRYNYFKWRKNRLQSQGKFVSLISQIKNFQPQLGHSTRKSESRLFIESFSETLSLELLEWISTWGQQSK